MGGDSGTGDILDRSTSLESLLGSSKPDHGVDIIASRFSELLRSAEMTYARLDLLEYRTREQVGRDDDPLWIADFATDYYQLKERSIQLSQRIRVHRNYIRDLERKQEANADAFEEAFKDWCNINALYEGGETGESENDLWLKFFEESDFESPEDSPSQDQIIGEYAALAQFETQLDEFESRLDQMEGDFREAKRKEMTDLTAELDKLTAQLKQNMAKLNYSATDLAKLLGISSAKLGKMLRGEQAFPKDILQQLMNISPRLAEDITDQFANSDKWMVDAEDRIRRLVTMESHDEPKQDRGPQYCPKCKKPTDSKVIASTMGKVKGAAAAVSIRDRRRQCAVCGHETDTCEVDSDKLNQVIGQHDRTVQFGNELKDTFRSVRQTLVAGGPEAEMVGPLLTNLALQNLPEEESLNVPEYDKLALLFDEIQNDGVMLANVWPHSTTIYTWSDESCGHTWHASPAFMCQPYLNQGCPICMGLEADDELSEFGEGEWAITPFGSEQSLQEIADEIHAKKAKQADKEKADLELTIPGPSEVEMVVENLETATELLKTSEAELEAQLARFKRLHDKGLITEAVLEEKQRALVA